MIYVRLRLYVPDNLNLRTSIIKNIYKSLSREYIGRLLIYNHVSTYYY